MKRVIKTIQNSPTTFILIGANLAVAIILQQISNYNTEQYLNLVYHSVALVQSYVAQGEWWRLFTAMFIHFDLQHLGYNLISLYVLGTILEKEKGSLSFILLYFISGIVGNIMTYAYGVSFSGGASGAVFGLVGVMTANGIHLLLSQDEEIRKRARKRGWVVFLYPLILIIPGMLDPRTNNIAHIFGGITGLLLSFIHVKENFQSKTLLRRVSVSILIVGCISMFVF